MARISIDHVSIVYENWREGTRFLAVDDVSIEVADGEFLVIVGPSGCGKTSLLNAVNGLVPIADGKITVDGREIRRPGADRAMVFQEYALFPWLNVRDNIRFGLDFRQAQSDRRERDERVQSLVKLVGLAGFEKHFPHELSGGMRQRVGLARALAIQPQVLLMDEPFAAIDAMTREVMQIELLKILSHTRQTVLFITHSIDEALTLGDRVVAMSRQPGRIKEVIRVDLPRPRWEQDVRTDPRFGQMRDHIWGLLRGEAIGSEEPAAAGMVS
jgi:NitT/TauT family transport system ATP-binding protein